MSGPGAEATTGASTGGGGFSVGGNGLGLIGTAVKGPAFVPISVQNLTSWITVFGNVSGDRFGSLAATVWLQQVENCTYTRILGIGDGKKRALIAGQNSDGENLPAGGVKNAGFVVGYKLTGSDGQLESNPFATDKGLPGRTYFLGAFMSESAGSTIFSDAGLQGTVPNRSVPILRGVLFAASGVLPALSGCYTGNASTASLGPTYGSFADKLDGGASVGSINLYSGQDEFTLLLNGHISTEEYPNEIRVSFNPQRKLPIRFDSTGAPIEFESAYIVDKLNTDPTKIRQAGHFLYAHYDIPQVQAVITGSGVVAADIVPKQHASDMFLEEAVFLVTSSLGRNASDSVTPLTIPNFENFNDRFATAKSPKVTSQNVHGKVYDLFRFHAIDDGTAGNDYKITISNIKPGPTVDDYGTFTVMIRKFGDLDDNPSPAASFEKYTDCDLNPSSDRYLGKLIGDARKVFNFDTAVDRQKFVNEGVHASISSVVRVEMMPGVERQTVPVNCLPIGFRGTAHLVTSGSSIMSLPQHPLSDGSVLSKATEWSNRIVEPPLPMRVQIGENTLLAGGGYSTTLSLPDAVYPWGMMTTHPPNLKAPNSVASFNTGAISYSKYYPAFTTQRQKAVVEDNVGTADSAGTVYDVDRFNNNAFSLENILIHTRSDADVVDNQMWAYAKYRRDRTKIDLLHPSDLTMRSGVRFFDYSKDFSDEVEGDAAEFLSFTFPLQGGFDGFNIFDKNKTYAKNLAAQYEMTYADQGKAEGPTVSMYMKALQILEEETEVDIRLLATPGIRIEKVTNAALSMAEQRFDSFYVMDIEQIASGSGLLVTGSEAVDPVATADRFRSRILDSSFGAAYFPDVSCADVVFDDGTEGEVFIPPSIWALSMFASLDHDTIYSPAAGQTRGQLARPNAGLDAVELQVKYGDVERSTLQKLVAANVNPITTAQTIGPYIYSQKTLLSNPDSLLQRISVRRMILELRREIKAIAESLMFEPNLEELYALFTRLANSSIQKYQRARAISDFQVIIDETTTTKEDVEMNLVRGRIIIRPSRSLEDIVVDF